MKNFKMICLGLIVAFSFSYCTSNNKTPEQKDSLAADSALDNLQEKAEDSAEVKGKDAELTYELIESMYGGVALMRQASEQGESPAVKALALKLVTEHSKIIDELNKLAKAKGWTLPAGEAVDDKEDRLELAKKTGKDYDKAWLKELEERHDEQAKKIENAKPKDPDLKALAEQKLPIVKQLWEEVKAESRR